jgi:hypothetical protein
MGCPSRPKKTVQDILEKLIMSPERSFVFRLRQINAGLDFMSRSEFKS